MYLYVGTDRAVTVAGGPLRSRCCSDLPTPATPGLASPTLSARETSPPHCAQHLWLTRLVRLVFSPRQLRHSCAAPFIHRLLAGLAVKFVPYRRVLVYALLSTNSFACRFGARSRLDANKSTKQLTPTPSPFSQRLSTTLFQTTLLDRQHFRPHGYVVLRDDSCNIDSPRNRRLPYRLRTAHARDGFCSWLYRGGIAEARDP